MAHITIKDIARESGYSVGTVSRALNNAPGVSAAAMEAVMKVVEKYDYEVNPNAKFLKQKNNQGIAVLIKGKGNRFFDDLADKIMEMLRNRGISVSRFYASDDENEVEEAMRIVANRSPEGMILLGCDRKNLKDSFSPIRIPCVLAGSSSSNLPFKNLSSVCTNDALAAQEAVEYLFSCGHKQLGVIGSDRSRSSVYSDRYYGVQFACYSREIPFEDSLRYADTDNSLEGGYKAFMDLHSRIEGLDAVFALADTMAMGALRAAQDLHLKVPEDVAILGFDGLDFTEYTTPRLSTVYQDIDTIARQSVLRLLEAIDNPPTAQGSITEEVPFTLCLRESTRSCPDVFDMES